MRFWPLKQGQLLLRESRINIFKLGFLFLVLCIFFLMRVLLIDKEHENYIAGIPEQLLLEAIIMVESSGDPNAISPVGARGLAQLMRGTWYDMTELREVDWSFDYSFVPLKNKKIALTYLRWLERYLSRYRDQWQVDELTLILAAYNAGPGAVKRHDFQVPPFRETRQYVERVKERLKILNR